MDRSLQAKKGESVDRSSGFAKTVSVRGTWRKDHVRLELILREAAYDREEALVGPADRVCER
jgi:hypothetical protein